MTNFITHKNTKIHYKIEGEGPAVVLIHGFLENLSMWDEISEALKGEFKVLRIDLLGHGNTENIGYVHSMEDMARYAKAVIDYEEINQYYLIGHSMGGYASLELAKMDELRISGLGLFHSTAFNDSDIKVKGREIAIAEVKNDAPSFIRKAIPVLFKKENQEIFSQEMNEVVNQALQTSQQSVIAALEGMKERKSSVDFWRNSKLKKFIQFGTFDNALNFFDNSMHLDGVENLTINELPIAHMGHIEAKQESLAAIKSWLKA